MSDLSHGVEKVMNIGNYESVRWHGAGNSAKAAMKALREMEEALTPQMVMQENQANREGLQSSPKSKVKTPSSGASKQNEDDF